MAARSKEEAIGVLSIAVDKGAPSALEANDLLRKLRQAIINEESEVVIGDLVKKLKKANTARRKSLEELDTVLDDVAKSAMLW